MTINPRYSSFSNILMISLMLFLSTLSVIYSTMSIYGLNITDSSNIIGIVKDGFFIVAETNETKKLTSIAPMEAVTPESGLVNLTQYEGKAILVSSPHIDKEWIFDPTIIDIADPIVTKLVEEVFHLK